LKGRHCRDGAEIVAVKRPTILDQDGAETGKRPRPAWTRSLIGENVAIDGDRRP
jgi:hypothetical protein